VALEIEGSNPSVHPILPLTGGLSMTNETPNPDDKPEDPATSSDPWARQPAPPSQSSDSAPKPTTEPPAPSPASAETTPAASATLAASETTTPGIQSDPSAVSTGEPVAAAPAVASETDSPRRSRSLPKWLPLVALAIVPALIVGAIVFFVAGGDDGGSTDAARIVDGLVRLNGSEGMTTYEGELPPEFADDFPIYGDVVVSIAIAGEEGTSYFIVLASDDDATQIYDFYSRELDEGAWQVEFGSSGDEVSGVSFLRPDNPDITGQVSIFRSGIDGKTAMYVSLEDISQTTLPGSGDTPFVLGASRPLPPGFPNDIPIYKADQGSVVIETGFQRGQGGQLFLVTFLTKDSQDDVIEFYTQDFEKRGWNVDEGVLDTNFALGIEFDDGPSQGITGSINADNFDDDQSYTKVDLFIQVSPTRRGN
jgi:hypothetical protein